MKLTRKQLRRLIKEAITASDKGVIDFPPEDQTARMPSGTAAKKSTMSPMIKDLLDMDDPDFKEQGLELADQAYEWEEGTAKKVIDDEKAAIVRAALGDDVNSLGKANKRRLQKIAGKEVSYFLDGLYSLINGKPGVKLISDDDLTDIAVQIGYGDPSAYDTGVWDDKTEEGWVRLKQIILQLTKVLAVPEWDLTDWIGKEGKAFTMSHEKIIVRPGTHTSHAQIKHIYGVTIHDPYYARLFKKGKMIIPDVHKVEYDL